MLYIVAKNDGYAMGLDHEGNPYTQGSAQYIADIMNHFEGDGKYQVIQVLGKWESNAVQ